MSFKHIAAALQMKVGDPYAKLILLSLADRADKETNQCWPSLARLAEDTHLSVATVKRKLTYLEEHGFITRNQRDQQSTLYTLAHPELSGWLTESQGVAHTELGGRLTVSHEPISNNLSKNHSNNMVNDEFELFWEHYPKKVGKGQARLAFKGALKKATVDELVSAVKSFSTVASKTEKQFIPHASTWLNGERWLDESTDETWGNLDEL